MKTLVLHLGLHKTATTSLQTFLAEQRSDLVRRGVHYVPLQQMRKEITPLIYAPASWEGPALARLLSNLPAPVILLSDENILGYASEIPQNALYAFAEHRVGALIRRFETWRIRILLTLRDPAAFLASMYCEHLRHAPFITPEEYFAPFDVAGFRYRKLFDWLTRLPAHVSVDIVPFEASLGGGLPVIADRVLSLACGSGHGLDLAKLPTARSRASFKAEEIELFAYVAERAGPDVAAQLVKAVDSRGSKVGTTKFEPFPKALMGELEQGYLADLAYFNACLSARTDLGAKQAAAG